MWLTMIDMHVSWEDAAKLFICTRHFAANCYFSKKDSRRLNANAVPSIDLPPATGMKLVFKKRSVLV